jgi:SAM-dependent methyltransferase
MSDPLAGSPWSAPGTVAGFVQSPPNQVLLRFARQELERLGGSGTAVDIGCGAGRNAVPLAEMGWDVVGTDLSLPMIEAAAGRTAPEQTAGRLTLVLAPMDQLPLADSSADLIIAHGIWNLARSATEFRLSVREASRVAKAGAGLFVFTFSRHTLPDSAHPMPGEDFVFTQFSGQPQCFLTESQLLAELGAENFALDPAVPLTEYNRPAPPAVQHGGPVIFEAAFRRNYTTLTAGESE